MQDKFKREINYLRISVTDRCNLRCVYCMPEEGVELREREEILSFEEFFTLVQAAVRIGITKVRITGGEPLVRKGIVEFIRDLRSLPQLDDIALTTNGVLLPQMVKDLKAAGLNRINLSLDTLKPERFKEITRMGQLDQVLRGIEVALAEGLAPVKLNTVIMRGVNEDEILDFARLTVDRDLHVRFIEIMPIGACNSWALDKHIPVEEVQARIEQEMGALIPGARDVKGAGPAKYYYLEGAKGTIGFISAISNHFCAACNRLRLTAEGQLRPCLHSKREIDLRTPLRQGASIEQLSQLFLESIGQKPEHHTMAEDGWADNTRVMSQIGG